MEEKHRSLTLSTSQSQQRWICKLANQLCKPIDIRSGFTSFKIKNLVNVENVVPEGFRTLVVYKFSCASCNACFVGETSQASTYFPTGLRTCLDICRVQGLVDHPAHRIASRSWTLRLLSFKLSLRNPTKPDLNQQVKHINLTLTL